VQVQSFHLSVTGFYGLFTCCLVDIQKRKVNAMPLCCGDTALLIAKMMMIAPM
jgi:hypothetical protein